MAGEETISIGALFAKQPPPTVHISRKHLFDTVAERIQLSVKQELALQIRPNDFAGKVEIDGVRNMHTSEVYSKEFVSDFKPTADEAIEDAYNEALKYLTKNEMVILDDFSHPALHKTQGKLVLCNTYLMFVEESEGLLENELDFKADGYKKLNSSLNTACKECSSVLPISVTEYKSQFDSTDRTIISYIGEHSAADPLSNLARSLVEMQGIIKFHGHEPLKGHGEGMKALRDRSRAAGEI